MYFGVCCTFGEAFSAFAAVWCGRWGERRDTIPKGFSYSGAIQKIQKNEKLFYHCFALLPNPQDEQRSAGTLANDFPQTLVSWGVGWVY